MAKKRNTAPKRKRGRPVPRVLEVVPVAAALVKQRGNLAAVARIFGVTRTSVQDFIKRNNELATVVTDARESMVDAVESRFYADCLKNAAAYQATRIFFLKTQGRRRGYTERLDELPPLEVLLGALPPDVADVVRRSLAAAVQSRGDPAGGPAGAV